jgi:hypothetical protein
MPEATLAAPPPAPKAAAPPPAKPAAPAAKPAAKVADAAPPPPPEHDDPFKDAFDEIDKEAEAAEEAETKSQKRKPDAPKTEAAKGAKANGDKTATETEPPPDEPKTNPELRAAYTGLKEKIAKEYEPKLKRLPELEAKLKELESRDETTSKATQDELAALKKHNAELENHIRFADYKQSKEYKELETTLNAAWSGAMRKLGGITISRTDTESGDTVERELTIDDIARYARLDPKLLWKELKQEIPDAAERTTVINHVQKIQDTAETVAKAEETARKDSETHAKTQTEAQAQAQAQRQKLWKSKNDALAEKYPKWFAKDEADPDGNAVFDRGTAFADLVFSPADLTAERVELLPKAFKEAIQSKKPFSQEALVTLHAIARNKLANHDRVVSRLKAASARIAELEASLKQFEDSGPDAIAPGRGRRAADAPLSFEEEIDALAR